MANSKTRFLLGFSDLRFSDDAGRSRNGSSRSRKGRAISDARPSAQKGTHAMERESRPSDSDSTLRSVLSPLRPPVPDVDEQFRNLELNPPSLVLIEVGDRTSPETHLENYMRCIEAGWAPKDARGRSGDKNYQPLARLRLGDSNPYDEDPENRFYRKDGKGHLRDACRHLKDHYSEYAPNFEPKSHAFYLREFWEKVSPPDPEPFATAIGWHGTYRFIKLKEIVDGNLHFPEDAEAERALREGWTHTTTPIKDLAVTKTAQDHLDDFFTEYNDHGDFKKARDVHGSARYGALLRLSNKPDYECSERELELKELWEDFKTSEEHLDDFFTEYNDHHGFKKARGVFHSARYAALERLKNKPDGECSERELQYKELWYNPLRNVPRELRDALMDIIETPETPREEALAELYRKIIRERGD